MNVEIKRMLITDETKVAITELRTLAYTPKFAERLRSQALAWNLHDDESFHFGAFTDQKLVSTIRLTYVEKPELFETILQLSAKDPFASLPCWILSRAATAPDHIGRSLNMQLRSEAYRFILTRQKKSPHAMATPLYVFGTALKSSQRLSFLQSIGYEFQPGQQKWDGYISAAPTEVSTFRLAIDKIESALLMIDPRR